MLPATESVRRCPETRAHYAHEFYTPLRTQCPGGPAEVDVPPGPCPSVREIGPPLSVTLHCQLLAGHGGLHFEKTDSGHSQWSDKTTKADQ